MVVGYGCQKGQLLDWEIFQLNKLKVFLQKCQEHFLRPDHRQQHVLVSILLKRNRILLKPFILGAIQKQKRLWKFKSYLATIFNIYFHGVYVVGQFSLLLWMSLHQKPGLGWAFQSCSFKWEGQRIIRAPYIQPTSKCICEKHSTTIKWLCVMEIQTVYTILELEKSVSSESAMCRRAASWVSSSDIREENQTEGCGDKALWDPSPFMALRISGSDWSAAISSWSFSNSKQLSEADSPQLPEDRTWKQ